MTSSDNNPEPSESTDSSTPRRGLWEYYKQHRIRIRVVAALIMHSLGFFYSVQAIMTTRTSQGAIAWFVSLNTYPYLAVPAYWVLGQSSFQDYEVLRRKERVEKNETEENAIKVLREAGMLAQPQTDRQKQQAELLQRLAMMPVTRHNSAKLLVNGDETFDSIFEAIDAANDYLLVQFFIFHDDELGKRLQQALIAKAEQGLKVYLLYDEIGSYSTPASYWEAMSKAGVRVLPFNTTQGAGNRFRLNFRNHRKVVIADGKTAFVGGHNVGDEYLGKKPGFSPWRDTHVQLKGPVVQMVQVAFVEDWLWASGGNPQEDAQQVWHSFLNWTPEASPDGDLHALCLPTGPADDLETCTLFFLNAINQAQDRLWIVSPYFVPDEQLLSALQLAALRGVDVRILIPQNPDHLMVYWSSFSYLEECEKAGVKVYRFSEGFLHQKVMLVDQDVSVVGTANFDNRSMRLNFEMSMLMVDRQFASEVEAMLLDDFSHSQLTTAADYTDASFGFRALVRLSRLMAPVQ